MALEWSRSDFQRAPSDRKRLRRYRGPIRLVAAIMSIMRRATTGFVVTPASCWRRRRVRRAKSFGQRRRPEARSGMEVPARAERARLRRRHAERHRRSPVRRGWRHPAVDRRTIGHDHTPSSDEVCGRAARLVSGPRDRRADAGGNDPEPQRDRSRIQSGRRHDARVGTERPRLRTRSRLRVLQNHDGQTAGHAGLRGRLDRRARPVRVGANHAAAASCRGRARTHRGVRERGEPRILRRPRNAPRRRSRLYRCGDMDADECVGHRRREVGAPVVRQYESDRPAPRGTREDARAANPRTHGRRCGS
jgi:hypothetical protein